LSRFELKETFVPRQGELLLGVCGARLASLPALLIGSRNDIGEGFMSVVRVSRGCIVALVSAAALASAETAASPGQSIYDRDCATCHGAQGKGDGETAAYLTPQPQDFTTSVVQKRSDEFLTAVIAKGGVANGLSESMPAFPKLSKSDLQSVVAYVRQLSKAGAKTAK